MKRVNIINNISNAQFSADFDNDSVMNEWIDYHSNNKSWGNISDCTINIIDITTEFNLEQLRSKRNRLLQATDIYMILDYPISAEVKTQYVAYRQYLRDLTTVVPLPAEPKTFEEFIAE